MGNRVKICGNANAQDARIVAALAPDFMGYIFWPGSKRFVTPEDVRDWARDLPPIPRVGVFVDATPDDVKRAVEVAGLFAAQLHGDEDASLFAGVARQIWKVIKIAPAVPETGSLRGGSFQRLESGELVSGVVAGGFVDAVLLDTAKKDAPGGTGEINDWNVARDFVAASKTPVLLAGGLTAVNVADSIRAVRPWGVDVSSGVESAPAKKDPVKVAAFIAAARGANSD